MAIANEWDNEKRQGKGETEEKQVLNKCLIKANSCEGRYSSLFSPWAHSLNICKLASFLWVVHLSTVPFWSPTITLWVFDYLFLLKQGLICSNPVSSSSSCIDTASPSSILPRSTSPSVVFFSSFGHHSSSILNQIYPSLPLPVPFNMMFSYTSPFLLRTIKIILSVL